MIDSVNDTREGPQQRRPGIATSIAIAFIRFYQLAISPLFPGCCRFEPTCSQYGLEAFRKHGFAKGFVLTAKRLAKCHPDGPHGYDPVP